MLQDGFTMMLRHRLHCVIVRCAGAVGNDCDLLDVQHGEASYQDDCTEEHEVAHTPHEMLVRVIWCQQFSGCACGLDLTLT